MSGPRAVARLAAAALLAPAAACGTSAGVADDGTVRVRATTDSVIVQNLGAAPVFTTVFGAQSLPLVLWAPCVEAGRCPPIPPGGARAEPRPAWQGRPEREAVVYWWRIDATSPMDVARPDSVRAVWVRFP